jgi:hypothetical protein
MDGAVASAFRIGDQLPAAFLWSWQGNMLLEKASFEDVEAKIEEYLRESPRIAVEALDDDGEPDSMLEALIRAEFARSARFDVVSTPDELARLRALKKESFDPRKADEQQCKLGAEISANSLVKARVLGNGADARLAVGFHNVETGCQSALATVPFGSRAPEVAVAEAVAGLVTQLVGQIAMPQPADGQAGLGLSMRTAEEDWQKTAKYVLFSDADFFARRGHLDGYMKKYPNGSPHSHVAQKWRSIMDEGIWTADPAHPNAMVRIKWMMAGGLTLGITWFSYALSASLITAISNESSDSNTPSSAIWMPWVPIAGPFLALRAQPGQYAYWKVLHVMCGVLEVGGAVAFLVGAFMSPGTPTAETMEEAGLKEPDVSWRFGRDWILSPVATDTFNGIAFTGRL